MGKIKLFPTTKYTSKQASDPVVPKQTYGAAAHIQQQRKITEASKKLEMRNCTRYL